jgi:lipopolysaccharide/colanic/teichoic acid biosynthesis glycosyltransferase
MEASEATALTTAAAQEREAEPVAQRLLRRALDLSVALIVLVVLLPLILILILAIRVDSRGPALFRQRRVGKDGREFTVLKFRTMKTGADPAPHREYVERLIAGEDRSVSKGGRPLYKLAVDDRITRVGHVLRRLSVDEIPQLWNVVRGDMSLVGPRPVTAYEAGSYPAHWRRRFQVKPGLTGLWQVSGRNERTYEEMVRFDLEYVQRRSVPFDLLILIRTVVVLLTAKGAA